MSEYDPEIEIIGKIIYAVSDGEEVDLEPAAWRRISNYALSLCLSAERAAAERRKPAEPVPEPSKEPSLPETSIPLPEEFHILRRARRSEKAAP